MDKSQEYANAIHKLSASIQEANIGPSQVNVLGLAAEKKMLQILKADADLSAKEIQRKIYAFYKID
jgi:hypothetical protein